MNKYLNMVYISLRKLNLTKNKLIDYLKSEQDKLKKSKTKKLNFLYFFYINIRAKTYSHTLANIIIKNNADVKTFKIGI